MSCNRAGTVLHGYFDNELDALDASEFERHLEQCSDCVNALETLESLRSSMNLAQLYKKAPAPFRKKVLASLGSGRSVAVFPSRNVWSWLAVAAAILVTVYLGVQFVTSQRTGNYGTELTAEIVDAHLRSLQPGHLTDVVSTDQHTVKPWFDGKLDFSPPVQDFADQGFSLQGGRIDVVHGRTVAALVYARRKHFVNVFIWPTNGKDSAPSYGSRQGYQWTEWRKAGMEFWAVTDAAPSALEQLRSLLTSN
ncbi:MAG: anti-sigma factor [Candidatus Acidiferrales bacterium]